MTGSAAKGYDIHNIDWVPTLSMGHEKNAKTKKGGGDESGGRRAERTKKEESQKKIR